MTTEDLNKRDIHTVYECVWKLSGTLMNGNLNPDDEFDLIVIIDKLTTMLAQWHNIK